MEPAVAVTLPPAHASFQKQASLETRSDTKPHANGRLRMARRLWMSRGPCSVPKPEMSNSRASSHGAMLAQSKHHSRKF